MTATTAKPKTRKKEGGSTEFIRPQSYIDSTPFTPEPRDLEVELERFRSHPRIVDNGGIMLFLMHLAEEILLPLLGREDLDNTIKGALERDLDIIGKLHKQH